MVEPLSLNFRVFTVKLPGSVSPKIKELYGSLCIDQNFEIIDNIFE